MSEIIAESYKLWKARDQIWISAPTGIGKSTFILDELAEHCADSGIGRVLLLENRLILKNQIQVKCLKRCGVYGCDEVDQDVKDFRGITIATYQEIETRYRDGTLDMFLRSRNIFYCVFDEAHYILEDSTFRRQTGYWGEIIKLMKSKICIFMSATIWDFWDFMQWHDKDLQWCTPPTDGYDVFPVEDDAARWYRGEPKKIWFYNIHSESRNICPWVYSRFDEVVEKINEDASQDKWIIFTSNKEKAKNELLPALHCSKIFLSSDERTEDCLEGLLTENTFAAKVLVATKVLDNGVDIKDCNLHNIVFDVASKTELLQMMGRKRWVGADDYVNIFLPRKSQEFFATLLQKKINPAISMFYKKFSWEDVLSDPNLYKFVSTFCVVDENQIKLNSAAKAKLFEEQKLAKRLVEEFQDNDLAFFEMQLGWLDLPKTYNPQHDLTYLRQTGMQKNLEKFLEENAQQEMDKEQQMKFREELQNLLDMSGVVLGKNTQPPGKSSINRYLKGLGWEIVAVGGKRKGEKTVWILKRNRPCM